MDYRFVSQEEFAERVAAGTFLEWKEVHGQYYGTPAQEVDELLAAGRIAILKIDVQGALAVMEVRPDAVAVFIMPPSLHDLEARLRDRGSEDAESIALRMRNASKEIEQAPKYHFRVVNDHVGRCVDELAAIVARYRDGVQTAGSEPIQ